MKIITGKTGRPHVTSRQFRGMMEGIIGQDSYVITHGENLEPELMTNNKLKIKSGMMCHHGNISTVEIGTYDEVTIQNGTQGMKRIDLIVNRYSKEEGSEIEENNWVVIQGIPSAETPVAPVYTEGNLQEGDLVDDCPVFEAHLDGINVTEIKKLLSVTPDMSTINKCLSELSSDFAKMKNYIVEEGSNANGKYRKWSDGTLEMWFNSPFTCAIGTKAGSIYTSGQFTLNFPVASKTKCNIVLTIGAGGAIWGKVYGSANGYKSSFSYHLLAATVWNTASFDLSYYARGTWK